MFDGLKEVMAEPPGGHNHGYRAVTYTANPFGDLGLNAHHRRTSLDTEKVMPNLRDGWGVVDRGHGGTRGVPGGNVLHPDEYVDPDVLRRLVEDAFGFKVDDVQAIYSAKKLRNDQRQLRADIDARVLALSRAGGNMSKLAVVLGVNPRTLERALARARVAEVE